MYKMPIFVVLCALSGCAVADSHSELTAEQMFIDCVHARDRVTRVRCETEYLVYRTKLDDQRKHDKRKSAHE